jgi:chromosome segregation ATPase
MSSPQSHYSSLYDIHEERIQRLEDDRADLGAQVAKQTATIEMLGEHMRTDMDRLVLHLSNMNNSLSASLQKLDDKIHTNGSRITKLETGDEKSEKWKDVVRKAVLWALTSGAAGLAGFLAQRYLHKG